MICFSEKRDPFISASYSGGTLLKNGEVSGDQARRFRSIQLGALVIPPVQTDAC
jgi:hypothetical protein